MTHPPLSKNRHGTPGTFLIHEIKNPGVDLETIGKGDILVQRCRMLFDSGPSRFQILGRSGSNCTPSSQYSGNAQSKLRAMGANYS